MVERAHVEALNKSGVGCGPQVAVGIYAGPA